ncbi:tyrosine-type recombinase/integrase [Alcaligenes endophyticus]|uniref:Site-specific integrase n=1 Tax=Alcaligenes endophyticus TaxID=1929088 RepID=A0ABT8EJV3_9BURK|nr:site-specific integrase [Alcaligenes endophyticus]MCX5591738.1 site-specific integrase [Alcaligenes endophyticus]MDN4121415.1 site-specific integrase [Alcaligenes endophyticus]
MKRSVQQATEGREQQELPLLGQNARSIDAMALFDTWLNRQQPRFLLSTQNVYRTLWRRFIEDMKIRQKDLHQIDSTDIQGFLATLEGVKRPQRERYQQVIARAYTEMLRHDPLHPNPAVSTAINDPYHENWRQAPDNDATQFLTEPQTQALKLRLNVQLLALQRSSDYTQAGLWRNTRDLAIVGLLLGCGLRPQELTQLQRYQWHSAADKGEHASFIHITGEAQRHIPVPKWLEPLLQLWDRRATLDAHELMFPSSRQLSAARPAVSMNPATLARIVTKWGNKYADMMLTPQRLRNVYGAQLFAQDSSLAEVEALMGYAPGAASAWRLQAAWLQWCQRENDPAPAKIK